MNGGAGQHGGTASCVFKQLGSLFNNIAMQLLSSLLLNLAARSLFIAAAANSPHSHIHRNRYAADDNHETKFEITCDGK